MNSPAISIVKWAQSQFPAILPGGVIDSKPLMKAGSNKTTTKYEAMKEQLLQEAKTNQSKVERCRKRRIKLSGNRQTRPRNVI